MIELNFSPGPAGLPLVVKQRLADELQRPRSFFESSHRRKEVKQMWEETQKRFLTLLQLPLDYHCLLMPGGARLQIGHFWQRYAPCYQWGVGVFGYWGRWAYQTARSYNPQVQPVSLASDLSRYDGLYYCDNETLSGSHMALTRAHAGQWLIADQTSSLFTQPFDSQQPPDVIIAACQKNLGFSGASIVLMHPRALEQMRLAPGPQTPLDYQLQQAMGNDACTPSLMHYWVLHALLDWADTQGGLAAIHQKRCDWAQQLYDLIDASPFLVNKIPVHRRSMINITFDLTPSALHREKELDDALHGCGCYAFRGHPAYAPGYRLNLYNALAVLDLSALCQVLQQF